MLRSALLAASRSSRARRSVQAFPPSRTIAGRFVAGETEEDVLRVAGHLTVAGLLVTMDHLGEDITDRAQAHRTVESYQRLISGMVGAGLASRAEVSVKLSAVGQSLPGAGEMFALERAFEIVRAAEAAGVLVTLDMEDHTTTDSTLRILKQLRADVPSVGCALQAALHRTQDDARALATAGSRVRLTKGAYREPVQVAHQRAVDIDAAYVMALETLMRSEARPLVATHDPALLATAIRLAQEVRRPPTSYEVQMLYGIRPMEQRRLAAEGLDVRVYVAFGKEWYGYVMRRLAERPASLGLFARALVSRR